MGHVPSSPRRSPRWKITTEVEVLSTREDKPITRLRTTITRQDGVVVLDGTALVWREPLDIRPALASTATSRTTMPS